MLTFFSAHPFLIMALIAAILSAIAAGMIGSFVVVKKVVSISGSIAHSVLGGMGAFLFLKRSYGLDFLSPFQGAMVAALLSAFLIGWIHLHYKEREDTIIAAIWSTGMALGVILIALTPGYNVELINFLFGNILWVNSTDLITLCSLDLLIAGAVFLFYRPLLAICFDEEQALLQKIPVKALYLLLLSLIAMTVVVLIQIAGAILVIALLAIPASLAGLFARTVKQMIGYAIGLGIVFSVTGIYLSYELNWPPGATIALVAALSYAIGLLTRRKMTYC